MASSDRPSPSLSPSAFHHHQRACRISRRTASSYEIQPFAAAHHRNASSSALPLTRAHILNVPHPPLPVTPPPPVLSDRRFSRLFSTTLGSPFVTTADLEIESLDINNRPRPSSPALTTDFSIIDMDLEDTASIPGSYPSRLLSPDLSFSQPRGHPMYTSNNPICIPVQDATRPTPPNSLRGLLPRIWDALSSPGRTVLNFSPAHNVSYASPSLLPSSRTPSPSALHLNQSWYTNNAAATGRNTSVHRHPAKGKGKAKTGGLFPSRNGTGSRSDSDKNINYLELPPLDGEEGELIDDEGCFMDVRAVHGIDILSLLPLELALHVFVLLCSQPRSNAPSALLSPGRSSLISTEADKDPHEALGTLLSCRLVSRGWCRLSSDNAVWRSLFLGRWNVDLRRAAEMDMHSGSRVALQTRSVRATLGKTWEFDLIDIGAKAKRVLGLSLPKIDAPITSAPLRLDWRILYRERLELDRRWSGMAISRGVDDAAKAAGISIWRMGGVYDLPPAMSASVRDDGTSEQGYEPTTTKITGHTDSVYCLEFDSRRIITGSRDRTIKVWSLRTGKQIGSFDGWHKGSVLCLKFEKDWDREWNDGLLPEDEEEEEEIGDTAALDPANAVVRPNHSLLRTGFMVSGSSDTTVCVWDLHLGAVLQQDDGVSIDDDRTICGNAVDDADREVKGEVRSVLKGHNGGVLDIRIDKQWIVSCSKDAVIRVWERKTLLLHRTLRGHEGPVNAVGLQSGKVVSASGDGKMILWDIESGERLRTFEGHDRGLACIEFKDDLIVSGSNDCKIKVWNASTGDCVRTLLGHDALVRALSFDPRNGRLVSASYDQSVKLWDLGTGKLVREFKKTHTSHIFDVKFDIARIVSTSHDQKIVVLDFSTNLDTALFV